MLAGWVGRVGMSAIERLRSGYYGDKHSWNISLFP